MKSNQLRGNCQCCGRLQAVTNGTIAKHGYKVVGRGEGGWFSGVCIGHLYAPMQVDRSMADRVVADVLKQAAELRVEADAVRAGTITPTYGATRFDVYAKKKVNVPFAECADYQQKAAVSSLIYKLEMRACCGESFAEQHAALVNERHGKPLQNVTKPVAPAPILYTEKRVSSRGDVLRVRYVDGAKVHWISDRCKGSSSSRAWRSMPMAD